MQGPSRAGNGNNPFGQKIYFHNEDPAVPFLAPNGDMPLVKNDDPNPPQEFAKGFAKVFDMSNEGDVTHYNEVINAAAKGTCILCVEVPTFSQRTNSYIIYARWMERYYAQPNQVYSGAQYNSHGQLTFRS